MPLVIISSEARPFFLPCIYLRFGARRVSLAESSFSLSPLADFTTATGMFLPDTKMRVDGGLPAKVYRRERGGRQVGSPHVGKGRNTPPFRVCPYLITCEPLLPFPLETSKKKLDAHVCLSSISPSLPGSSAELLRRRRRRREGDDKAVGGAEGVVPRASLSFPSTVLPSLAEKERGIGRLCLVYKGSKLLDPSRCIIASYTTLTIPTKKFRKRMRKTRATQG